MIDIWMLFTMIIPFLEVVLHTTHEVFKNKRSSQIVPETRVDVLKVNVVNGEEEGEDEQEEKTKNIKKFTFSKVMSNFTLPICSLVFTIIFWGVGLIKAYSSSNAYDVNMSDCLTTDLV